jgi:hypothetical protein
MSVSVSASPVTLTLNWNGLDTSQAWLGWLSYANSTDVTVVSIG